MPELPAERDRPSESQALARLDLGTDVPPALRQAVGAALEWVDRLGRDAAPPQAPPRDRIG